MSKVLILFVQVITIITLRTLLFIICAIHMNVIHILVQFSVCLREVKQETPFLALHFERLVLVGLL